MLDAAQFQSAEDMMAHYRALKRRINAPPPRPAAMPAPAMPPAAAPAKPKVTSAAKRKYDAAAKKLWPFEPGTTPKLKQVLKAINCGKVLASNANALRLAQVMDAEFGFPPGTILGTGRKAYIVRRRFEYYYYLVELLGMKYLQAARVIKRDHTSLLHGVQKYKERLLVNE